MTDNIITGEVSGMAFGGQGIVRHQGLVVFVPFAAPGELIRFRITKKKSSFAHAELLEVLSPSPQRVIPKCPYFGHCGGCQLQHLENSVQLEYKRQSIEDTLKRIGRLSINVPPVIASQSQWAYRRHISMHIKPVGNTFEMGYIATDNRSLIPVTQCPIFTEESDPIIHHLREKLSHLQNGSTSNEGKAVIFKNRDHRYLIHLQFQSLPSNYSILKDIPSSWSGLVLSASAKIISFGNPYGEMEIEGLNIKFSSEVFLQNHPEQSLNIYRHICRLAETVQASQILDLYCGIGISSLLLAKQGREVHGIESNPHAIQLAKENALQNKIDKVIFQCGQVEHLLKKIKIPEFVIVNPPRTGLDPHVCACFASNRPQDLIYISCMPSTLARDLKQLSKHYELVSCQGYDMFPQTAHVETVVHLRR